MDKRRLNKKVFKISDEKIKELYLKGYSMQDIAKIAQDTKGLMALRKRLHDLGVDTTKNMIRYSAKFSKAFRKYSLDESVFDIIDTEEKAYWLGFFYSDGYNHEDRTQISLRLHEQDREILEKLQLFFKTNCPIRTYSRPTRIKKILTNHCELGISSIKLSKRLAELGCTQGKTYTLIFPKFLNNNLIKHFIRGYFDGDGCLSVKDRKDRRKKNGKCMSYQLSITGKEDFIKECQKHIMIGAKVSETNINKFKNNFAVSLHYGGKKVVSRIMNYLYKDSTIYLKRKHDIFIKYCISAK